MYFYYPIKSLFNNLPTLTTNLSKKTNIKHFKSIIRHFIYINAKPIRGYKFILKCFLYKITKTNLKHGITSLKKSNSSYMLLKFLNYL